MTIRDRALGRMAGLWDALPPPFRRRVLHATNDRFLVGVVGLIPDDEGRVLMLEHRFRTPWRWGLPGGWIRHGETLTGALRRELHEEIGRLVEPDEEALDTELNTRGRYLSITLRATLGAPANGLVFASDEIVGGGFFAADALPEGTYPYHAEVVRRLAPRLRLPRRNDDA